MYTAQQHSSTAAQQHSSTAQGLLHSERAPSPPGGRKRSNVLTHIGLIRENASVHELEGEEEGRGSSLSRREISGVIHQSGSPRGAQRTPAHGRLTTAHNADPDLTYAVPARPARPGPARWLTGRAGQGSAGQCREGRAMSSSASPRVTE